MRSQIWDWAANAVPRLYHIHRRSRAKTVAASGHVEVKNCNKNLGKLTVLPRPPSWWGGGSQPLPASAFRASLRGHTDLRASAHRLPSLEKILRAPVSTPVHHVLCISPFFFVLFTAATTDAVRALSLRRWLQLRFDCKKLHYTIRRPTSRSGCCALRPK